ncbi:hypothetical protein C367_00882 [Cryptococcus neoformans Ze90-1]|nr:hypothetical protein C367_00882 [Cryptococcus neoformans var. grubii Ze90-1]
MIATPITTKPHVFVPKALPRKPATVSTREFPPQVLQLKSATRATKTSSHSTTSERPHAVLSPMTSTTRASSPVTAIPPMTRPTVHHPLHCQGAHQLQLLPLLPLLLPPMLFHPAPLP